MFERNDQPLVRFALGALFFCAAFSPFSVAFGAPPGVGEGFVQTLSAAGPRGKMVLMRFHMSPKLIVAENRMLESMVPGFGASQTGGDAQASEFMKQYLSQMQAQVPSRSIFRADEPDKTYNVYDSIRTVAVETAEIRRKIAKDRLEHEKRMNAGSPHPTPGIPGSDGGARQETPGLVDLSVFKSTNRKKTIEGVSCEVRTAPPDATGEIESVCVARPGDLGIDWNSIEKWDVVVKSSRYFAQAEPQSSAIEQQAKLVSQYRTIGVPIEWSKGKGAMGVMRLEYKKSELSPQTATWPKDYKIVSAWDKWLAEKQAQEAMMGAFMGTHPAKRKKKK